MALLEIYEDDDATLLSDLPVAPEVGGYSPEVEFHVWNHKGNSGGQAALNTSLIIETEDPNNANVWLRKGLAPQDEMWSEVKVIGKNNTGDATYNPATTDWMSWGAYKRMLTGDMPANCALHCKYRERAAPGAIEGFSWRRRLAALFDEYSAPMPSGTTEAHHGILTGLGDPGHSGLITGLEVTASSPADDAVHVALGMWTEKGELLAKVLTDHTLNQTAADGALAASQAYKAAITVGATASAATVTKGNKATSPTKPTPPAGELLLAWVTVDYQAGGTSVIETADIEDARVFDRYLLVPVPGERAATIHAGQQVAGGTWRFRTGTEPLAFDAATTSWVWQLAGGTWTVTTTATPPTTTAGRPLWKVTTDATEITAVVDLRSYAGGAVVLHLRGDCPASPGEIVSQLIQHEALELEAIAYRISDNGGGAADQTKLDLLHTPAGGSPATVYVNNATEDTRPVWAFGATTLTDTDGQHETTHLYRGDVVALHSLEYPDADASPPTWAECYLICREPR